MTATKGQSIAKTIMPPKAEESKYHTSRILIVSEQLRRVFIGVALWFRDAMGYILAQVVNLFLVLLLFPFVVVKAVRDVYRRTIGPTRALGLERSPRSPSSVSTEPPETPPPEHYHEDVVRMASEDLTQAYWVLALGLMDDPMATYILPRAQTRGDFLRRLYNGIVRHNSERFVVRGPSSSVSAAYVAVDVHSSLVDEAAEMCQEAASVLGAAYRSPVDFLSCIWFGVGVSWVMVRHVRPLLKKGEVVVYLKVLCVLPQLQGKGLGSQLLKHLSESLDGRGAYGYLETFKARNVTLYERHGWEVVEAAPCIANSPTMHSMLRKPRSLRAERL